MSHLTTTLSHLSDKTDAVPGSSNINTAGGASRKRPNVALSAAALAAAQRQPRPPLPALGPSPTPPPSQPATIASSLSSSSSSSSLSSSSLSRSRSLLPAPAGTSASSLRATAASLVASAAATAPVASSSSVTATAASSSVLSADDMVPNDILPTLQNIVSTVNLGCKLDLKEIALRSRNAEYNPKRFAAVIMRIRDPKTTALIFASGKLVCTGAKSEKLSRTAARKYARIIQKLGFDAKFTEFKIQNIVGSCDVRFPIRLEGLAYEHEDFSSYEPELFPGLIYRMLQPKVVLLIFVSGKIVLTGAKTREGIYDAFHNIYPVLKKFKKDHQT